MLTKIRFWMRFFGWSGLVIFIATIGYVCLFGFVPVWVSTVAGCGLFISYIILIIDLIISFLK